MIIHFMNTRELMKMRNQSSQFDLFKKSVRKSEKYIFEGKQEDHNIEII